MILGAIALFFISENLNSEDDRLIYCISETINILGPQKKLRTNAID